MTRNLAILVLGLSLLMLAGIALSYYEALPLLRNEVHEARIAYLSFESDQVGTWFTLKLETEDLFAAFNPINVSVHTGATDPAIRSIQLEFEGASTYFPGDFNFSDPSFYPEQYDKLTEAIESNILFLERDSLTTFAGNKLNLNYTSGGDFDIGITVTYQNGAVAGYGLGDTSFVLKQAIRVSPPEALVQLRNGNLTLGLAWLAIGLTMINIGLGGLIDIAIKCFKS